MEHKVFDKSGTNALDYKNPSVQPGKSSPLSLSDKEKPGIVLDYTIASATPQKTNEPLTTMTKRKDVVGELPEKYRTITEFFNRMVSSVRLLGLCKKSPTFENISRQVEILTGRKFSYSHLAQIKYILPEAVQTDKILVHDQKTLCMKRDIKITFIFDVIRDRHEQSVFMSLQKLFATRLLNFFSTHPEGFEIPEASLPALVKQSDKDIADLLHTDAFKESQPNSAEAHQILNPSHVSPNFRRHFSQKTDIADAEKISPVASPVPPTIVNNIVPVQNLRSGKEQSSPDLCSKSNLIKNPIHQSSPHQSVSSFKSSTPLKLVVEADSLLIETPALSTPKRSMPSCDNKLRTMTNQKSAAGNMSAKRFLDFGCSKVEEQIDINSSSDETEWCKSVHGTFPQTTETKRSSLQENVINHAVLYQKVEQTNGLFDLASSIHRLLQSVDCFSITKAELIHKLIMDNCEIVERREIEEQIELLEKMVPDWICTKLTTSGDVIYKVKKLSDLNSVRERLNGNAMETD